MTMRPAWILPCSLLGLLWLIGSSAEAVVCSGSVLNYAETGNDTASFGICGGFGRCQQPAGVVLGYSFNTPGCDPNLTACGMTATVSAEFPGNHQNDPGASGFAYSFAEVDLRDSGNGLVGSCGISGAVIAQDFGLATVSASVSCSNQAAAKYTLNLISCPSCPFCPPGVPPAFCTKTTSIPLNFAGPGAANCPTPPPEDCKTCGGCVASGGGGPAGCSIPVSGALVCSPEKTGPGANLRYLAGGAGGTGFPAETAWRAALGLYWSHDYAQRIVPDPDFSHVWLITDRASFREFSDLAAGSGLRLYQVNAPSDEYRRLSYDTATGGWQLDWLDGRKDFFRADGLFEKTVLSQNPTHPTLATYNVSNQLESVSFPDGRSETFTYYPGGKLESITEVPVAGSSDPPRTWTYLWNGDELTHIERPDATTWEFTYDPAKNGGRPGYLTQVRLIGTDLVTGRVEAAFEYDGFGNVIKSWSGDTSFTGPNAVDRQEFAYTNPQFPTRTDVTEWIDATQNQVTIYEFDRDPLSIKARVNQISGDCPVCGTGPNSQFSYDDTANPLRPTQIIDGKGLVTLFAYDANGQITSKTEAVGTAKQRLTTWQYTDPNFPALPTRIEMPSTSGGSALRVTIFDYGTSGNLEKRTIEGAESGSSFSFDTVSTFNGSGQPLSVDPPGYGTTDQTSFTYDPARGDLIPLTRTDPLLMVPTTFGHDGFNRRTSTTDPNGVETVTAFDDLNRTTSVTQKGAVPADDLVTTYEYTLFGDLFRTILPRGNIIEYGYDTAGRLTSIERKPDASTPGERTFYTLNTFGHRTKEELQRWNGSVWVTESFTDFVYSSRCHLDKTVNADGTATEYAYDCNGNLSDVWDANHPKASNPISTQHYEYDELNRLETVTQPWTGPGGSSAMTIYDYDVQDHLTVVTDAESNTTTYTYSDRDLMTQEISPVSGTTTSTYNEHGELTSQIDARAVLMTRVVDELDRVEEVHYPDNTLDTTYTYDDSLVPFSKGRLTKIQRGTSEIDYTYDRFGRVEQDGTLAYEHDKNGNRTRITYPGGAEAIYTHDFADREETLSFDSGSGPQPLVSASAYKPFGPLTSASLANGLVETRLFDNRYRPDRIQVGSLLDWDYTEDAVGNPTQITGTIVNQPYTATFDYQDPQYFLTDGNGPWGTRTWTYDRIGNRLTHLETGEPQHSYTYAAPGHNPKLLQITPALGHGAGSRQFGYDAAGNQISVQENDGEGNIETTFLDASDESRLSTLRPTTAPGRTDMLYDGRGYLREAHLTFAGSPELVKVTPTYSSEGLLMSRREERAWSGSLDGEDNGWLALNDETTHLFYFAGRPIAQLTDGPELIYLSTDHLGTPVLATTTTGIPVWAGGLEPFGRVWTAGPDTPDPEPLSGPSLGKALRRLTSEEMFLRYPGQWASDAFRVGGVALDVYYNLYRYYQPGTGRYSRPDPLGLSALNPIGPRHLYSYGENQPTNNVDPLGLYSVHSSCNKWCGPPSIGQCSMSPAGQCVFPMIADIVARVFRNQECRQALEAAGVWRDTAAALMPTSEFPKITCHEADCEGPGSSSGRYYRASRSIPICSNYFVLRWEMGAQTLFHEILHDIRLGHNETERNILRTCYPGFEP